MSKLAVFLCATALLIAGPQASKKNFKSRAEYDLYTQIAKDLTAGDFAKALTGLDAFSRQFPDSEFRDDRELLYIQAWSGAKQPAKAVDAAASLIDKDLDSVLSGPADVIKLLYTTSCAVQEIADPSPQQLATGKKAAQRLVEYSRRPEGVADKDWEQARSQLQAAARVTLLHLELLPGSKALDKNDCAAAETIFSRALSDYPDSAQAAWYSGRANLCLYKTIPEKASAAIYGFARAAAVDPVKGMVDPQWQKNTVEPYLEKIYNQYHGPDPDGLKQLKELAAQSPIPPAGFVIKSQTDILAERQAEFETQNPQLALWIKIKAALTASNGQEYFTSTLKDAAVPQLKGVLVEAKPACRPTQLLVAIPLPDAPAGVQPEIALKLDKPLSSKPEPQTEFHWEGVPTAFTASPFLLTMDTESAKVSGLKTVPCAAAPPGKTPVRKRK